MDIKLENVEAIFIAHNSDEVRRYARIDYLISAMINYEQELRNMWEYAEPNEKFKEPQEAIDWCRSKFYECLNDCNVALEDF
jgi:hypothetical protein